MNGQQSLQAIIDFQVELHKFVNIDLFQRGLYQIRINHHINSKIPHKIEVSFLEDRSKKNENRIEPLNIAFPSSIINGVAVSKTFNILYKNEEVVFNDVIHFKDHLIVDSANCLKQLSNVEFYLDVELWFTESAFVPNNQDLIRLMFRRQLKLHFNACSGLHYYLPVTFDYFHLSTITVSVHACLVTLCLPYLSKQSLNNKSGQLETSNEGSGYDHLFFGCSFNEIQNQIKNNCTEILKLRQRRAQLLHWQLCSLLLTSIQNLSGKFNDYLKLLPPLAQFKYRKDRALTTFQTANLSKLAQNCHRSCLENGFKSADSQDFIYFQNINFAKEILNKKSDKEASIKNGDQSNITDQIDKKDDETKNKEKDSTQTEQDKSIAIVAIVDKNDNILSTTNDNLPSIYQPEDYIASIVSDLAYICGSLIVTWQSFIKLVTHNEKVNQYLSKAHFLHRCKRFSEAFFVKVKPLNQLILPDFDGQLFFELNDKLRKSKYLQDLPKCKVECPSLDGDFNTMPIIFEEKFNLVEELTLNNNINRISTDKPADKIFKDKKKENLDSEEKKNLRRSSSDLSTNSSLTNSSCNSVTNSSTDNTNNSAEDSKPNQKVKFKDRFVLNLNKLNFNGGITRRKSSISYLSKQDQQKMVLNENLTSSPSTNNSNNSSLSSQITSKSLNFNLNETDTMLNSPRIVINNTDQIDGVEKNSNDDKNSCTNSNESPRSIIEELGNCPAKLIGFRHYNNVKGSPDELLLDTDSSIYSIVETISLNNIKQANEQALRNCDKHKKKMTSSESLPDLSVKHIQKIIKHMTKKNSKKLKLKRNRSLSKRIKSAYSSMTRTKNEISTDPISLNFSANIDTLNKIKKIDLDLDEEEDSSDSDGFIDERPLTKILKKVEPNEDKPDVKSTKSENDKPNNQNNNKCTILEMFAKNACLVCGGENCNCIQEDFELTGGTKRLSMITNELIAFIEAKEQFRFEMNLKTDGWLIYSDFLNPASGIPYFQCENDLIKTFNSEDVHLIVCVHGLDGNCADLRLVKTYLELGLPTLNFDFLMSESNTGRTYESFEVMTDRLADEILSHINTKLFRPPTKVSFIGHSLGNIIIRSVLRKPELNFLLPKLHCFLSLSGPHLGTIYMTNGLVNMGLWLMQKWKKSTSLLQLCLKDHPDPYKTFIYNLSKDSKIHLFKYVLLCGSSQDHYVPKHSAHIRITSQSMQDNSVTGKAYREMINNILRPFLEIKEEKEEQDELSNSDNELGLSKQQLIEQELKKKRCSNLIRFDVWHADAGGTNSLIGRQAHIAVLDCELFIEKFMAICGLKYFA